MPAEAPATALVGVDWGTSNLRGFRYDESGEVRETREAARGLLTVTDGAFEPVLAELIGDWCAADGSTPILLCGMVGSQQGWREAPYLACPAGADAIGRKLMPLDTRLGRAAIVPGLSTTAGGIPDVIRGEETKLVGAIAEGLAGIVVMPGTHPKWAQIEDGCVAGFRTFMTGELFVLLTTHSILGRMIEGEAHDPAAFAKGVRRALADSAITSLLFSARTEALFGNIPGEAVAAYLSGLLIGAELRAGLAAAPPETALALIAKGKLGARYREALAIAGWPQVPLLDSEDIVTSGLWALARPLIGGVAR